MTCSQKYQNEITLVNIGGFRPCLSKPSYRAPKWALMVRLMQKERLKSPQKSLIIENQTSIRLCPYVDKTTHAQAESHQRLELFPGHRER